MSLVAPFSAAGLRLDLAGSDRSARVLKFQSAEHPEGTVAPFGVRETVLLDASLAGLYQLTRQMEPLVATTGAPCAISPAKGEVFGNEPGVLLARLARVPLARHFETLGQFVVSRDYEVVCALDDSDQVIGEPVVVLLGARVQCRGVLLKFSCEHDDPLRVEMSPAEAGRLRIPPDLLAVLGKSWRAAYDYGDHWRSTIRINRHEPMRTNEAEQRIADAVAHLAQTLSAPPGVFHHQHRPNRWRVMFRRAIPLGGCVALIGAALLMGQLPIGDGSIAQMMVFHAPPLLLIGLFLFRELPRFEVPPIPRKLRYARWVEPAPVSSRAQ